MRFKTFDAKVKSDDGAGEFEALVSVFGNVDSTGDRVVPGAFAGTLARWAQSGDPIPVIWSHRWEDPDYHIGHVVAAEERDDGLWVRGQLDLEHSKAQQVYRLLKGRRVTQFSFAYDVVDERRASDGANELLALDVFEVGPTLVGANRATDLLAVKAGRVLSARNESDLRAARDLLDAVISQVEVAEPEEEDSAPIKSGQDAEPSASDEEPDGAKSSVDHAAVSAQDDQRRLLAAAELELLGI